MFWNTKVHAKVAGKIREEVEGPPLVGASKETSLMFITAMQYESRSMWKRSVLFVVSFAFGGKTRDFYVDRDVFDTLEEGYEGILTYSGNKFISFEY